MSGKRSRSITAGIHCMGAMFDSNTVSSVPVAGSHRRAVLSSPPEASRELSGLKVKVRMASP